MTTHIKLSDTQIEVLTLGADRPNGCIEPMPARLNSLLRAKVIAGLANRGMISDEGGSEFHLTDAGYEAVGRDRGGPAPTGLLPTSEAKVTPVEAAAAQDQSIASPKIRENTKQAQVIAMLRRPEGATVAQICASTGWQAHTVRGAFASAFKKKLGLDITSSKDAGAERCYRIG